MFFYQVFTRIACLNHDTYHWAESSQRIQKGANYSKSQRVLDAKPSFVVALQGRMVQHHPCHRPEQSLKSHGRPATDLFLVSAGIKRQRRSLWLRKSDYTCCGERTSFASTHALALAPWSFFTEVPSLCGDMLRPYLYHMQI